MNKAIYMPKGKAGEYAKYAVNFYVGCSNDCAYCYCKRGVLGHAMGAPVATLKKCFKDEINALRTYIDELHQLIPKLKEHGLFFTFSSDPMLKETRFLTMRAVEVATANEIPCKILTKRADFIEALPSYWFCLEKYKKNIAFGFTLTGYDELEPFASSTQQRIECMRKLHEYGFKTFASIEPVIDLRSSAFLISNTASFCDQFLIGLLSGQKSYTPKEVDDCLLALSVFFWRYNTNHDHHPKVYIKDSAFEYMKKDRKNYPYYGQFLVDKDYNLFTNNEPS